MPESNILSTVLVTEIPCDKYDKTPMWNGNKPRKMKKYVLKNKIQQRQCSFADPATQEM